MVYTTQIVVRDFSTREVLMILPLTQQLGMRSFVPGDQFDIINDYDSSEKKYVIADVAHKLTHDKSLGVTDYTLELLVSKP